MCSAAPFGKGHLSKFSISNGGRTATRTDSNDEYNFVCPARSHSSGTHISLTSFTLRRTVGVHEATFHIDAGGVILVGADDTVLYGELPMPAVGSWGRRCLLLNAESFRLNNRNGPAATQEDFDAVIGAVTNLYLPAEFGSIVAETVGIDRVELSGPCLADVNLSGAVDLGDLTLILADFGSDLGQGDLNCDGIVDLADLNAVLAAFGSTCG